MSWINRVIPIAVKRMQLQVETRHLRISNLLSFGVPAGVDFATHDQSMSRPCGPNQIHDNRQTFQRPASPVSTDKRKQPVFNLVPLACPGREMTDRNRQPHLIGQSPEFPLPQAGPGSVASARIGCDQQGSGLRVGRASHRPPPPSNALDGKGRRVMVDTDAHPTLIASQVIDSIGNGLSLPGNDEVVDPYSLRTTLWAPLPACILEIANQFLLFRVHRNNRLADSMLSDDLPIDVFKLCISVRVLVAFTCLSVRLQTVSRLLQKMPYQTVTDRMSHPSQLLRQHSQALGCPPKRRLRVSPSPGFHQRLQVCHQPRILLNELFPASSGSADSRCFCAGYLAENLLQTLCDGATRYSADSSNDRDPAMSQRSGFGGRVNPPAAFVQRRGQSRKLLFQRFDVHSWDIDSQSQMNELFIYKCLVVAWLPPYTLCFVVWYTLEN